MLILETDKSSPPPTHLSQLTDADDSTPIKLHAAADAIHPRPQNHHRAPWEGDVMLHSAVCQVEVVGACWPLGGHRVNLTDERRHTHCLPCCSHRQLSAATCKDFHNGDMGDNKISNTPVD